jgi:Tfp pilus assembly protein PilF
MALRRITADVFARTLKGIPGERDKRFAFFLGAGCSVSSGIPDAGSLVKEDWLPRLRDRYAPNRKDLHKWAKEEFPRYNPKNAAAHYGAVMARLFPFAQDRQQEVERLCAGCFPGFGYAVVSGLMALGGGCFNVVLTTNFDDLIADALYLFTESRPLVIPHESLAAYIRPTHTRPLVVKLHGDHRLSPQNTTEETARLKRGIENQVRGLLHDRGLIFIGYGGNDRGIVRMLKGLPREALPLGAYWVSTEQPPRRLSTWLESREAIYVEIRDFDELMLLVKDSCDLPSPDRRRFEKVFDRYMETYASITQRVAAEPSTTPGAAALKAAASRIDESIPGWWSVELAASRVKDSDPAEAERIYEEGLERFPKSVELLGNYAAFLHDERKDYERADEMYRRAIDADPQHANNLGNYAILLHDARKDYERAEEMYRRAIDADPQHANNLANYAIFLHYARKDYERAEEMYRRAIDAAPRHADYLGNYAGFLLSRGRREAGLSLLAKVLEMRELEKRPGLAAECWFYAFAHRPAEQQLDALANLRRVLIDGARSPGWDLSQNIERARQDGHPDVEWLEKLAQVINGKADISELDGWDKWRNA